MKIKINKLLVFILLFFFLFQDSITRIQNLRILDYLDELFILVLCLWAILIISFRKKKISNVVLVLFIGSFIFSFIGIVSCYLNSKFIFSRVLVSNFLAIKFFIMIIAIIGLSLNNEIKKYIIEGLEFISKIVICVAIFNFFLPSLYQKIFTFAIVTRRFGLVSVTSLFYHTGRYGWFMLFMAILYYAKYKKSNNSNDKKWMFICILFSLLSFRTKVLISIIVIIIFENILNGNIKIKQLCITLLSLVIFGFIFKDILINTYQLYFTDESGVSARQALNDNGVQILKDYFPLGVGFGKYASWYARIYYSEYYYKYNMTRIHGLNPSNPVFGTDTFWPAIFGETGFLGSIVYIFMLYYIFLSLRKKESLDYNCYYDNIYSRFAILSLLQTVCESMGEPSFNSPPQNIFLALIIGLALSDRFENKK